MIVTHVDFRLPVKSLDTPISSLSFLNFLYNRFLLKTEHMLINIVKEKIDFIYVIYVLDHVGN